MDKADNQNHQDHNRLPKSARRPEFFDEEFCQKMWKGQGWYIFGGILLALLRHPIRNVFDSMFCSGKRSIVPFPVREFVDGNGVNVFTGLFTTLSPPVNIGGDEMGLTHAAARFAGPRSAIQ